jgi:hypothetical protein
VEDEAVARVLLDQLARGEVVLEIDDHGATFACFASFLAHVPALVIGGEGNCPVSFVPKAG